MLITASLAALPTGLVLETMLTGNMDNHKYFSHPMYFLASLTMLGIPNFGRIQRGTQRRRQFSQVIPACSVAAGLAWGRFNFGGAFWDFVGTRIMKSPSLAVELLRFVTTDSRFIVAVLTMVFVLFRKLFVNSLTLTGVLLFPLVFLTLADRVDQSRFDYSRVIDTREVEEYLGGQSEKVIGRQLRQVTSASEIIATNHIIGEDFSLAAWSEREFLLLGTRFFTGDPADRDSALQLSTSFADNPDEQKCKILRKLGVRWFIVDLSMTHQRDWSVCAQKSFAYQKYIVLALES